MLKIDRQAFLALALGMNLGGCYTSAQPAAIGRSTTAPQPAVRRGMAPVQECVEWTPAGECSRWEPQQEAYAPTNECTGWTPAGECNQWEPHNE